MTPQKNSTPCAALSYANDKVAYHKEDLGLKRPLLRSGGRVASSLKDVNLGLVEARTAGAAAKSVLTHS